MRSDPGISYCFSGCDGDFFQGHTFKIEPGGQIVVPVEAHEVKGEYSLIISRDTCHFWTPQNLIYLPDRGIRRLAVVAVNPAIPGLP